MKCKLLLNFDVPRTVLARTCSDAQLPCCVWLSVLEVVACVAVADRMSVLGLRGRKVVLGVSCRRRETFGMRRVEREGRSM